MMKIYTWYAMLQVAIMKLGYRCRAKAIVFTDRRVRVIHEILTCIKLIKFYAWEQNFEKSVGTWLCLKIRSLDNEFTIVIARAIV